MTTVKTRVKTKTIVGLILLGGAIAAAVISISRRPGGTPTNTQQEQTTSTPTNTQQEQTTPTPIKKDESGLSQFEETTQQTSETTTTPQETGRTEQAR